MNKKENYLTAFKSLKEAQQLLSLAIEKGIMSSIERDLFLEKLRNTYDAILFEKEIDTIIEKKPLLIQPDNTEVEIVQVTPIITKEPEIKPQVEPEQIITRSKIQPEESPKVVERMSIFDSSVRSLSIVDEKIEKSIDEKPIEQSIQRKEQAESLAERFQGKQKFMTDSLSKQFKEKPVASQLQEKPITDLTKEIGVHDRFLFTKELFNGDSKSFEETLIRVNQFKEISEALIYIQENFSWNENSKAANKFIELIRRKLLNT